MKVPFVDLRAQYQSLREEMDPAILGILERGEYVQGPTVAAFEKAFAQAHGAKHAIACNSGTSALHLALWGMGIGEGDEVITPANTFIATVEGILLTGARPVLVDVLDQTLNMDPAAAEAAITDNTKAILPVHLFGLPAEMDELQKLSQARGLELVEDSAQAHLASHKGQFVGRYGKACCFSFYPAKNLGAAGEGGGVLTDDDELCTRMRVLRDHGMTEKNVHEFWGHNYRMAGLAGASLGVKLPHLPAWNKARRAHAARYIERLNGIQGLLLPPGPDNTGHVYHLFVVRVTEEFGMSRDTLRERLGEAGIGCGIHYPIPIHLQKAATDLGYGPGSFPVVEKACEQILSLPMFAELRDEQIDYVCDTIRELRG